MKLDRRLTDSLARSVKLPSGKIAWDGELAGFGVRAHASGARSWHTQYDFAGRTRLKSLGPIEALPATKARSMAVEILARVRLGEDPIGDQHRARAEIADSFGAQLPRYFDHKRSTVKPATFREINRYLVKDAAVLHPRLVREIDRKTVASLLAKTAGKSGEHAANAVRSALSAYFAWLISEGLLDVNPIAGTIKRTNGSVRTRILAVPELAEIWRATLPGSSYGDLVRTLLLVGCRRQELGSLRWEEIDLAGKTLTLSAARMKHGRQHTFVLPKAAIEIISSRPRVGKYVFGRSGDRPYAGWSASFATLRARINANRAEPVPAFVLHDTRRGIATAMGEQLDIAPHVISEILAHQTYRRGSDAVYLKGTYAEQRRAAIERWSELLLTAVEGRDAKVVTSMARPLSKRRK
jgi:integrase